MYFSSIGHLWRFCSATVSVVQSPLPYLCGRRMPPRLLHGKTISLWPRRRRIDDPACLKMALGPKRHPLGLKRRLVAHPQTTPTKRWRQVVKTSEHASQPWFTGRLHHKPIRMTWRFSWTFTIFHLHTIKETQGQWLKSCSELKVAWNRLGIYEF